MRLAKPILLTVIAVALAAYAVDCGATTPEQAMRCCKAMPCSSHGHHGRDCCKTMPAMHAPFVQPSSVNGASISPAVFAVLPAADESLGLGSAAPEIVTQSHAPPIFCPPAPRPLRI